VDEVLARALHKDPDKRFPSAGEFGDALAEALGPGARAALPTVPDSYHRRNHSPQASNAARNLIGGGAVGVLLGVALMRVAGGGLGEEPREPVEATEHGTSHAVAWLASSPEERPRAPQPSARRVASPSPSASVAFRAAPAGCASAPPAPVPVPAQDAGRASDVDAGN
jgi:hypothetical protein